MKNKKFWKTMKPLMTNKGVLSSNAIIIEENNQLKIIKELDANKSTGQDQIPASIIKMASDILNEPITKMFNRSIAE